MVGLGYEVDMLLSDPLLLLAVLVSGSGSATLDSLARLTNHHALIYAMPMAMAMLVQWYTGSHGSGTMSMGDDDAFGMICKLCLWINIKTTFV